MGDSDICPHCGMGRRIDYELFKSDKEERKKSFEDYEKDYLDRVKNGDKPKDTKPEPENNPAPDNWNKPTVPNSGSNKGMKIAKPIKNEPAFFSLGNLCAATIPISNKKKHSAP